MSELSEVKIIGSGTIAGGEYSEVSINGKGRANGDISCTELKVNGNADCKGRVVCKDGVIIKGIVRIEKELEAKTLKSFGKLTVKGNASLDDTDLNGVFDCEGKLCSSKLVVSGSVKAKSDIEAENINITGSVNCDGLINAENITLKMESKNMHVGSIGGGMITAYPGYTDNVVNKITPLKKVLKALNTSCKLIVKESIEGDILNLECVEASSVCGRIVIIGEGCQIDKVQYSEKLEIAEGATVGSQIKV